MLKVEGIEPAGTTKEDRRSLIKNKNNKGPRMESYRRREKEVGCETIKRNAADLIEKVRDTFEQK